MSKILETHEIEELVTLVEEVARSTKEGVKRFVEPARGTLRRAKTRRHHIVFGRRGSGKTSLLQKAMLDLDAEGRPNSFVDLEPLKEHAYPDILISSLLESFTNFKKWIDSSKNERSASRSIKNLFGLFPSRGGVVTAKDLSSKFENAIRELHSQLHQQDFAELRKTSTESSESKLSGQIDASLAASPVGSVSGKAPLPKEGMRARKSKNLSNDQKLNSLRRACWIFVNCSASYPNCHREVPTSF